jgi:hypothetical protein
MDPCLRGDDSRKTNARSNQRASRCFLPTWLMTAQGAGMTAKEPTAVAKERLAALSAVIPAQAGIHPARRYESDEA